MRAAFSRPGGYVAAAPAGFKEYYHGTQDIPQNTGYLPIRTKRHIPFSETLKQLKEAPPASKKEKTGPSHEER